MIWTFEITKYIWHNNKTTGKYSTKRIRIASLLCRSSTSPIDDIHENEKVYPAESGLRKASIV